MLDIAIALHAGSLAVSVAKFSGIIKDKLSLKLDRLAGSEFEAGLRALEQAATSQTEREHLLREARRSVQSGHWSGERLSTCGIVPRPRTMPCQPGRCGKCRTSYEATHRSTASTSSIP